MNQRGIQVKQRRARTGADSGITSKPYRPTHLQLDLFCCAEFSSIQESFWGNTRPYLTVRVGPTYMSHNENAFFVGRFKQFYFSNNFYDSIEYTLKCADIEPGLDVWKLPEFTKVDARATKL